MYGQADKHLLLYKHLSKQYVSVYLKVTVNDEAGYFEVPWDRQAASLIVSLLCVVLKKAVNN